MPTELRDRFGRLHTSLRVSVTDRCNIRCYYCMPQDTVQFRPRHELLTFEEIARFVAVSIGLGIRAVRITGGEPLVRSELHKLVRLLKEIDGVENLSLTTNGMLLAAQADQLRAAGLDRLNISLDTLNETVFRHITRRTGLRTVLAGIAAAQSAGFTHIRLNALAIRGVTEDEIIGLVRFARHHDLELRFIEFMPLDADQHWQRDAVLTGTEVRRRIEQEFGTLIPCARPRAAQPAIDFRFADGAGRVGFINSVSAPFCGDCDRLRLTAEGQVRNCLFSTTEWDARELLRRQACADELERLLLDCVAAKKAGHGSDNIDFVRPERAMYQIGG